MGEPITIGGDGAGGTGGNRRVLVLAGVAVALLLAVVVLPGVLFSGGDSSSDDAFPSPSNPSVTTTVVPPGPAPAETFEPFTSKNPFEPLVDLGTTSGPPAEDPSSTSTVPPFPEDEGTFLPDDGSFTFPDDGSGTDESGSTTTTAPPPPARQPDRVSLLEVFTDPGGQVVASVRVNDDTYQVAEGDDFATSYRVLDLDLATRCGQFLFGDDRFGLCEDEETLK